MKESKFLLTLEDLGKNIDEERKRIPEEFIGVILTLQAVQMAIYKTIVDFKEED